MTQALLKFVQGALVGNDGEALVVDQGLAVTVTNSDNAGVLSWRIELLYAPPDSVHHFSGPILLAEGSGGAPSVLFTPDVVGSYRFRLTVYSAAAFRGLVDVDIRNVAVVTPNHHFLVYAPQLSPPALPLTGAGAKPNEFNFGGQPFGWAGDNASAARGLNETLKRVDTLLVDPPSVTLDTPGVYTIAIPEHATELEYELVGPGGSGGSGYRGAPGTNQTGGGGGGAGARSFGAIPCSVLRALGSEITVTVGAPGVPGASATVDDTANAATPGTHTEIAVGASVLDVAQRGRTGSAGATGTSVVGIFDGGYGTIDGQGGAASNPGTPSAPSTGISTNRGAGGGGGGISSAGVIRDGGVSGYPLHLLAGPAAGGTAPGGHGDDAPVAVQQGAGGGGGASDDAGPGGKGGDGSSPGGGGGGGGSRHGHNSGAGGNGGNGRARLTWRY